MPRGKPNALKRALIAEEQRIIFEGVLVGKTVTQMAEQCGISRDTGYRRFKQACADRPQIAIDDYRTLELSRLDRIVDRLTEILDAADAKVVVSAATALVRVQERRAKLLGMDAAIKVEQTLTVRNESSVDEEIRELSEMLGLNDPGFRTPVQAPVQIDAAADAGITEQPATTDVQ